MNLRVAVQMDPLEQVNIEGDSTFAIMLGAQLRGHRLFHYAAEDLNYSDGRLWTRARPVTVQRGPGARALGRCPRFGERYARLVGSGVGCVGIRRVRPGCCRDTGSV